MGGLWLTTSAGRIEARYLPPERPVDDLSPAVIYAHGNGELMGDCMPTLEWFLDHGVGVFLFEYPGYGRSQGAPSEASIREAALAAYDLLAAKGDVDPRRILAFGQSLGGGAACLLARERPVAALVLQSTFTSLRSFAWRYGAPPFLLRDRFENIEAVRGFAGPVFVAHGTRDRVIPPSHGKALAKAARHGELHLYDFAHDCAPGEQASFYADLEAFLERAGILAPGGRGATAPGVMVRVKAS